jgi:hypothetical protein
MNRIAELLDTQDAPLRELVDDAAPERRKLIRSAEVDDVWEACIVAAGYEPCVTAISGMKLLYWAEDSAGNQTPTRTDWHRVWMDVKRKADL